MKRIKWAWLKITINQNFVPYDISAIFNGGNTENNFDQMTVKVCLQVYLNVTIPW